MRFFVSFFKRHLLTLKLVLNYFNSVTMPVNTPIKLCPLCQLPAGTSGSVCELKGDGSFKQHVRELGFGESSQVTKVSGRSTIICKVNGARIALSHGAASQILVNPLG